MEDDPKDDVALIVGGATLLLGGLFVGSLLIRALSRKETPQTQEPKPGGHWWRYSSEDDEVRKLCTACGIVCTVESESPVCPNCGNYV